MMPLIPVMTVVLVYVQRLEEVIDLSSKTIGSDLGLRGKFSQQAQQRFNLRVTSDMQMTDSPMAESRGTSSLFDECGKRRVK